MLKQLSGMDSLFLYTENHRAPLEVGCLQIYDPSTAPNGEVRFKEILATFQERLDRIDLFRQKLIEVPFSLDYPYWTEDRDFDLEYHVRHISLPKPGDWEQLMAQVARLQARQLDHTRPLWMAHVIGGLGNIPGFPEGAFAVFMKFHHAAIDGATGQDVQALMHDREPLQADASSYRPSIGPGDDNKPGTFSLLARTPFNTALRSTKLGLGLLFALPGALRMILTRDRKPKTPVPVTILNPGRVTPNRSIGGRFFDLGDFRAIRATCKGATVNDVALTIIAGGIRYYLEARESLPDVPLVAGCPIHVANSMDEGRGRPNLLSIMTPSLHTDVRDPVERLRAIRDDTLGAKATTSALGKTTLTRIPMNLPAPVARNLYPLLVTLGVQSETLLFNTLISNVAIDHGPLYFSGAKLVKVMGTAPPFDQWGAFHTVVSYGGEVSVTFTACRDMLPDPGFYAECIEASFDDLRRATLGKPATRKKTPGGEKKGARAGGAHSKTTKPTAIATLQ
ncbi:MAG: wax ester/triacylglycerol synthase family O-acyltransferase [Gammaproteobacteria bacterium]|nr:wax ester/triacylglycerol synthase family O-acyltransferase [Gammaproteobacteria bacterium]